MMDVYDRKLCRIRNIMGKNAHHMVRKNTEWKTQRYF